MSEEKKQMTVGDLKETLKSIKLPSKPKTRIIAMIMAIPTWGAIWWPLLRIQLIGLIIMLLNIKFRDESIF
jgi:hypothetical protein